MARFDAVLRRLLTLTWIAAVFAVVAVSALATRASSPWQIKTGPGNAFSGTYTNPTASVVNGVSIGTADKSKNPITAFTFAGQTCGLYAPYGSAFCYTNISVAPGKSATFTGTTQTPVGKCSRTTSMRTRSPATTACSSQAGFQACSTADGGMDNTCTDVGVATAPAIDLKAARNLLIQLSNAIESEQTMLNELKHGNLAGPKTYLGNRGAVAGYLSKYAAAIGSAPVSADVTRINHDDDEARDLLDGKQAGRIKDSRNLIDDALTHKRDAVERVNALVK